MRKLLLTTTIMLTLTHVGPDNADAAEPIGENSADETKEIFSVEMPAQPVATEMPETEAQKTEVPSTEGPSTELPSTEMSKTEQPVTEKPRTERPIAEIATTETPRTEAPAPVTRVPLPERPSSETTVTEQPLTKQPPLTPAPSNSQNQSETPSATRNPELVDAVEPQTDIQPEADDEPARAVKVGRFHPESAEKFYRVLDKRINDILNQKLKPQEDKKPLHLLPETGEEKSYFAVILLMMSGISLLVFSRFKA
ncbi:LPXTG cell wall anchor domain-containing protein [Macrococcus bovicus]|uniref:LPXTG cell wall anchor domain-containing protein n=1 Tax=Macrococcus bovicus TaxID=69968 RepID=A0A4R6BZJ2_9STAP|nr:LPXTG cell wall anchor domain-containing protein [Macrococcus bovicus]TDM14027.1 hypothetical protein ERX55_07180 [Macrococcus bovicus]